MHEIITLQFGSHSNYIGTHFWNTQESYFTYAGEAESLIDHDIHFRSGIGIDKTETFTPRTLIYDFKSAYGSLKSANSLYEDTRDDDVEKLWHGQTKVQKQPEIPRHPYQEYLDEANQHPCLSVESVRYWSDFNKLFYHPRSMVQLNDNELSGLRPLETWQAGEELFDKLERDYETYDYNFRHFVEECDQLQGLQIFTAADDAWGGFASKYADRLRDDFEKSSIWIWATENSLKRKARLSWINLARSLSVLPHHASMYIPLINEPLHNSENLLIDWRSSWHGSALQAAAIESMTLPSRLKKANRMSLTNMEQVINALDNRHIVSLALGIAGEKTTEENEHLINMDLSYSMRYQDKPYFKRLELYRGLSVDAATKGNKQGASCQSYQIPLPFPITDSFPPIFGTAQGGKLSLAAKTSLSTSTATGCRLNWIIDRVKPMTDITEREEIRSFLSNLAEDYTDSLDTMDEDDDY